MILPDPNNTSRYVKMAPRKFRRTLQGKDFKPVYYHGIPVDVPHKKMISALGAKDRRAAKEWNRLVNTALDCVAWGATMQYRHKMSEMKKRHDNLKLQGLWVERGLKYDY